MHYVYISVRKGSRPDGESDIYNLVRSTVYNPNLSVHTNFSRRIQLEVYLSYSMFRTQFSVSFSIETYTNYTKNFVTEKSTEKFEHC